LRKGLKAPDAVLTASSSSSSSSPVADVPSRENGWEVQRSLLRRSDEFLAGPPLEEEASLRTFSKSKAGMLSFRGDKGESAASHVNCGSTFAMFAMAPGQ
jgi:hypothetical protein